MTAQDSSQTEAAFARPLSWQGRLTQRPRQSVHTSLGTSSGQAQDHRCRGDSSPLKIAPMSSHCLSENFQDWLPLLVASHTCVSLQLASGKMFRQADRSQEFIQKVLAGGRNNWHLCHFTICSNVCQRAQPNVEVTMFRLAPEDHLG